MPMLGVTFAAKLLTGFSSVGFVGMSTPILAQAIGDGAMLKILGTPFDTIDTGTGTGTGVGTGVGLVGIVGAVVAAQIQTAIISSSGSPPTPDMINMTNAIGDALQQEVALATLITSHSPMYVGVATITPGSIGVTGSDVGDSIKNTGILASFIGSDWPDIAKAIGTGIGDSFALANATITVVGAGPPPPAPFVGPNTISPAGVLL